VNERLRSLADLPVLGYAIRWLAALARLPGTLRSQGESIRQVHDWVHQAAPGLAQVTAAQSRSDAVLEKIAGDLAEVARIARESHAQGTWLTERSQALAAALEGTDGRAAQLRAGLDRHVPTILQQLAESENNIRNLKQWFDVMARDSATQRESLDCLARSAGADRATLEALAASIPAKVDAGDVERLVAERVADLDRRMEAVLPVIESTKAGHLALQETVRYLLQRVEFVRRETLFELRYGKAHGAGQSPHAEPRILAPEKLASARRSGLRVNLGCGHVPMEGYVNVDQRELPGVDVVADANRLPFDPGSIAEIFSSHMLEHFPREQLRRELLPYWRSLVADGGTFRAVVPDADSMIRKYGRGEMSWEDLREVTFGSQDYSGDFHYDMFTTESLGELLREAGFRDPQFPVVGRINGRCLEMEVVARK